MPCVPRTHSTTARASWSTSSACAGRSRPALGWIASTQAGGMPSRSRHSAAAWSTLRNLRPRHTSSRRCSSDSSACAEPEGGRGERGAREVGLGPGGLSGGRVSGGGG
eukprot:5892-Chlamydomonas_euryale.AAC.2